MDYEIVHEAKLNNSHNGDAFFVSDTSPQFLMIADGLGSGVKAKRSSNIAASLAKSWCLDPTVCWKESLTIFLAHCHQKLKRTQGAAIAAVVVDRENRILTFGGIGNIRLVVAGGKQKALYCQPGIVGVQMPRKICTNEISIRNYTTGFFFSDGISIRSVLRAAQDPHRPLNVLAEEILKLNGNLDDRTLIVFSFYEC